MGQCVHISPTVSKPLGALKNYTVSVCACVHMCLCVKEIEREREIVSVTQKSYDQQMATVRLQSEPDTECF